MNDQFSVFDSWGNKVGDFIPTGGGCVDSVIGLFAMIILWTIGLAVYALIKLIAEGFKALGQGKWGLAIACFIPIWLPIILMMFLAGAGGISIVNQQNQQNAQETQAAYAQETQVAQEIAQTATTSFQNFQATQQAIEYTRSLQNLFRVDGVKLLMGKEVNWNFCGMNLGGSTCDDFEYIQYTVMNTSNNVIDVNFSSESCMHSDEIDGNGVAGDFRDVAIKPGGGVSMVCHLFWTGGDPNNYTITLISPGCLNIYPFTGISESCN